MESLLFKRPIAYFIDFAIMWCVCVLPQLIAYSMFNGVPFKYFTHPYHVYFWVLFTVSLPIWLYFILLESSAKQSTFGKRIMRLKVFDIENAKISIRKSVVRTFLKLLPWEITHIGLIPIYFSKDPQPGVGLYLANGVIIAYILYFLVKKGRTAVHDVLSKTKVVMHPEIRAHSRFASNG